MFPFLNKKLKSIYLGTESPKSPLSSLANPIRSVQSTFRKFF